MKNIYLMIVAIMIIAEGFSQVPNCYNTFTLQGTTSFTDVINIVSNKILWVTSSTQLKDENNNTYAYPNGSFLNGNYLINNNLIQKATIVNNQLLFSDVLTLSFAPGAFSEMSTNFYALINGQEIKIFEGTSEKCSKLVSGSIQSFAANSDYAIAYYKISTVSTFGILDKNNNFTQKSIPLNEVDHLIFIGDTLVISGYSSSLGGLGIYKANINDIENITKYKVIRLKNNVSSYIRLSTNNIFWACCYQENGIWYIDKYYNCTIATITTNSASSITTNSAICSAEITNDGGTSITSRGVCWNTAASPTIANNSLTSGTGTGQFSVTLQNLLPNTTYYYRAFAINSVGVAYGDDKTFTTLAALPTLTTTAISSITSNSATSGGNITNDGNATITVRGICWSTTASPTIANNSTNDGTGNGQFTGNLTNLQPNTKYYVRAYAINSAGISYGNEISFTTLANLPTLTTTAISTIAANSAASGGNITSDGNGAITARGVCWATTQNPTITNSKTTDGTGTGQFTSNLTGLSANTKYYVRAYATNSSGTVYGSEISFTTLTTGIETALKDDMFKFIQSNNEIKIIPAIQGKYTVSIFDLQGKLLFSKTNLSEIIVQIQKNINFVLVKITTDKNQTMTKKLVLTGNN